MSHLLRPRKGWENERLASYLLSRFSFIARPTSIADDLGSDFFCTIFEIQNVSGTESLAPRNSFAIQVKSSADAVSVDNKIDYLDHLELPFFIGVVSQSPPEMKIYSAEFLPLLFSELGKPGELSLMAVAGSDFDPDRYYERVGTNSIRLRCPLVVTLKVDDDRVALAPKVDTLLRICTRGHGNIATRVGEEHIYDIDGKGHYRIMAGSGSAQFFRDNFLKRLGEVFYNLYWLLSAGSSNESLIAEFRVFESLYHELESLYGRPFPEFVSVPYGALKAKLSGQSV